MDAKPNHSGMFNSVARASQTYSGEIDYLRRSCVTCERNLWRVRDLCEFAVAYRALHLDSSATKEVG